MLLQPQPYILLSCFDLLILVAHPILWMLAIDPSLAVKQPSRKLFSMRAPLKSTLVVQVFGQSHLAFYLHQRNSHRGLWPAHYRH